MSYRDEIATLSRLFCRFSNPADPPSVTEAREKEKEIIAGWIKS